MIRPGVAFVSKYGMTFALDRETGKPLIPIKEVKVPVSTAPDVNSSPDAAGSAVRQRALQQVERQRAPVHGRHRQPDQRVRAVRVGDGA